jgi:hypothetical protein
MKLFRYLLIFLAYGFIANGAAKVEKVQGLQSVKPDTKVKEEAQPQLKSDSSSSATIAAPFSVAVVQDEVLTAEKTKNDILGIKLSLSKALQKKIGNTRALGDKLINSPEKILEAGKDAVPESPYLYPDYEKLFAQIPFWPFRECDCIPRYIRTDFAQALVKKAVALYKQRKNQNEPFVWVSFASGDLFNELYMLTLFVRTLQQQGINNINLQLVLIDEGYRNYIKTVLARVYKAFATVGVPFLMVNKGQIISSWEQPIADISYRFVKLLQWLTQDLSVNMNLYVYGTAQEYVYDVRRGLMAQNNVQLAVDFWGSEDLPELTQTLAVQGYFCALGNESGPCMDLDPKDKTSTQRFKEHLRRRYPKFFAKEAAEVDDKQDKEDTQRDGSYKISQKVAEYPKDLFKEMLIKFKGDKKKLERLFVPLVPYPDEFEKAASEKENKASGFDILKYFKLIEKKLFKWEDVDAPSSSAAAK